MLKFMYQVRLFTQPGLFEVNHSILRTCLNLDYSAKLKENLSLAMLNTVNAKTDDWLKWIQNSILRI